MVKAKDTARDLRRNSTPEERKLWLLIKDRQLGHKFRRQVILDKYYLDFCCFEKRLIIELDGSLHKKEINKIKDREREKYLESQGFRTIRFWNSDLNNERRVINQIKFQLNSPSSALRASSRARGEEKMK